MMAFMPAGAQTARPSDKDVEQLIARSVTAAEQFERSLDGKLKSSMIRGANGEVHVANYLSDYRTNLQRVSDRFKPNYAASSEVLVVLRGGNDINKFMTSQPPSLKGRSEWDTYVASMRALAAAYGTTFPVVDGNPPRRMNDLEIQQAADDAVKSGSNLKKSLPTVYGKEDKTGIKTAQTQIDAMTAAAKGLKARVDDGKPASGEAAVFAESVKQVRTTLGERVLPADARAANDRITASLSKVEQAFDMNTSAATSAVPAAVPAPAPAATPPAAAPPADTPADALAAPPATQL
jgi:hypothetical protein